MTVKEAWEFLEGLVLVDQNQKAPIYEVARVLTQARQDVFATTESMRRPNVLGHKIGYEQAQDLYDEVVDILLAED